MNIAATYDYLTRARRDLWRTLEAVPDALLSRPLIEGVRFECLKDYVLHIAEVEDGWINGDIRGGPMLQRAIPEMSPLIHPSSTSAM
ncbi:MAG TPA: DinB family protein, partial [Gemmatimonadaceae bacterium]|nr:DinB family protein [Gemmatimonadaceae bacterium]